MSRIVRFSLILFLILTLPRLATADVVTDWNLIAEQVAPRFGGPQPQSRGLTIVQIAVHDALNAIDARYASYTGVRVITSAASPDAAVAAAARRALLDLLVSVPDSMQ